MSSEHWASRTFNGRVTNLETRVDRLERKLRSHEDRILSNKKQLDESSLAGGRIDDLQAVVRGLKADVAGLSDAQADSEDRLEDLEGRVGHLESESWATQLWGG